MRESLIEKKVCDYAKEQGFLVYKFSSPSQRGVPDRMFIYDGGVMFIEFKAPGKKMTKLQSKIALDINRAGVIVHTVDDVSYGEFLVLHFKEGYEARKVKKITINNASYK